MWRVQSWQPGADSHPAAVPQGFGAPELDPTVQGELGWSQMTDPSGQQWGRGRGGGQGLTARS